ncbi:DUF3300 domain-containing protein, partial [Vineibacter terrae]|uniref:DUF3300 domain-containing protein n=1 Tax=Vineibacter terrae TaxID=2586908 RepID=UPI002E33FD03
GSVVFGTDVCTSVAQAPPTQNPPPQSPESQPGLLTATELDELTAPVALYPDALLAQMLPAAAYPLDIVRAQRWIDSNKAALEKRDFSAADKQDWDVSVKSMVRFPDLVKKMNDDLEWTTDIGQAFVAQPKDLSDSIQRLRRQARQAGSLKPTPEQRVVEQGDTIVIQPAKPDTLYVPQYNPTTVYATSAVAPVVTFGAGVLLGAVIASNSHPWDWHRGYVYPPVWIPPTAFPPSYYPRPPGYNPPGYNPPGYRPGLNPPGYNPPGYGPGQPWRPDPDRYRPAAAPRTQVAHMPPAMSPRPATLPAARPASVAPKPAQRPHASQPAARQRTGAQRTVFDHAGDTGRTEAFRHRGASSRSAAGLGERGGRRPPGGNR